VCIKCAAIDLKRIKWNGRLMKYKWYDINREKAGEYTTKDIGMK